MKRTPLHSAIHHAFLEGVKLLLMHWASVTAVTGRHNTVAVTFEGGSTGKIQAKVSAMLGLLTTVFSSHHIMLQPPLVF